MISDFSYKTRLDEEFDKHVDFIVRHLPKFPNHAILMGADGDNVFINLSSDIYTIDEIVQYLQGCIAELTAVQQAPIGAIFAYKNEFIRIPKDDPHYNDYMNGLIDESSIPDHMRVRNIMIYAEVLGPHRRGLMIPLDADGEKNGDMKKVNPKMFPWFPLIPQNEWVN